MAYKDPDKRREAQRKSYARHKGKWYTRQSIKRVEMQKFIDDHKKTHPCKDCRRRFPACAMLFDDWEPVLKLNMIYHAVRKYSWRALRMGVRKYDLLCLNCRAIRTYYRAHSEAESFLQNNRTVGDTLLTDP